MNPKTANPAPTEEPALVYEYTDPVEGFKGWYVRDRICHRICAGGMRVQKGLTRENLARMARNMTLKMQIADLRVDGAKSGIDYDPAASGKQQAVARFLEAIRPYIESEYSMGPDLNLEMEELEKIASRLGIPSVKMAVARAQEWPLEYFFERNALLQKKIDGFSLSKLRAGYGLGAAVIAVLNILQIDYSAATVAIQGFGSLAKGAAYRLHRAGVRVVAVSDIDKCLVAEDGQGLNILKLIQSSGSLISTDSLPPGTFLKPSSAVTGIKCDIIVPAAVENSIPQHVASSLHVKAVVPRANLAVPQDSINILQERSILVLPDFLAGCGGSLSMEGLYGPDHHPDIGTILIHIDTRMSDLVQKVMQRSLHDKISPTEAALTICRERQCLPATRPYGNPE